MDWISWKLERGSGLKEAGAPLSLSVFGSFLIHRLRVEKKKRKKPRFPAAMQSNLHIHTQPFREQIGPVPPLTKVLRERESGRWIPN